MSGWKLIDNKQNTVLRRADGVTVGYVREGCTYPWRVFLPGHTHINIVFPTIREAREWADKWICDQSKLDPAVADFHAGMSALRELEDALRENGVDDSLRDDMHMSQRLHSALINFGEYLLAPQ